MTEDELLRIGFFDIGDSFAKNERSVNSFKLFECYNGVFLRIIVSKRNNVFTVDHIYFNSPNSDDLIKEFFGTDLTVSNIVEKIKLYRENEVPSNSGPETF